MMVIIHPITLVSSLFVNMPIISRLLVIIIIGMMAKGRAKLKKTWLITNAFMGFIPIAIIIMAGAIVTIRLILVGILIFIKPSMTVSPAMAPTAEDENPEASKAMAKMPLDNEPSKGERDWWACSIESTTIPLL